MDPPRGAGDGRHEVQVTPMVPIMLPALGNLACRLLIKVLVRVAWVKQFSNPVPVSRRSAPPVVPQMRERQLLMSVMMMMCLSQISRPRDFREKGKTKITMGTRQPCQRNAGLLDQGLFSHISGWAMVCSVITLSLNPQRTHPTSARAARTLCRCGMCVRARPWARPGPACSLAGWCIR